MAWIAITPDHGYFGIGAVLTVTVAAMWNETGLVPRLAACCVINGVNVSSSFTEVGRGLYALTYSVGEHDGGVFSAAPTATVALSDPRFDGVGSDAVNGSKWLGTYTNVTIDTTRPSITLTCVPWNNTRRPTVHETICVDCGVASSEPHGCRVYYSLFGDDVNVAAATGGTTAVLNVTFSDGSEPTVRLWAVDAAGNAGPLSTLTWIVDAAHPLTKWPPGLPSLTNKNSLEVSFGCSKVNCHYQYSFDNGSMILSSHSSNDSLNASATPDGLPMDTLASLTTARVSAAGVATVQVAALRPVVRAERCVECHLFSVSTRGCLLLGCRVLVQGGLVLSYPPPPPRPPS